MKINAIILAGGNSTRMLSKQSKVLHKILEKRIINYVLDSVNIDIINHIGVITNPNNTELNNYLDNKVDVYHQEQALGTGHAVMMAKQMYESDGYSIILMGDCPLITSDEVKKIIDYTMSSNADAVVVSAIVENNFGYGRIIRENKNFAYIVEQKDTTVEEALIKEINTGIYCIKNECLNKYLTNIDTNNASNEYYLTDILEIIKNNNGSVNILQADDYRLYLGINTKTQLHDLSAIKQDIINTRHLENGVLIIDKTNTYIGPDVVIERDVKIFPNTYIYGKSHLKEGSIIYPGVIIYDKIIEENEEVKNN